jgi:hypothetical protein
MAHTARGQEGERLVQVHGFGTAAYGNTNHNDYSVGDPKGDYDHGELSLVVLAQPADRLTVSTNLALEQEHEGVEPALDFAFAEWRFSDAVKLRAGRVKQPFGLYTEIFDVGTLRPFVTLPEGLYGPAGLVSEGFDGLSLTGRIRFAGRWALAYDAYGGSIQFSETQAREDLLNDGSIAAEAERVRDVVGGRLNVETPVGGLVAGVSGYTGREDNGRHAAAGVHVEYLSDPWSLRTELAHLNEDGGASTAFYVEAARRIGKWQVAARHDRSDTSDETLTAAPDSLRQHRDTSLGLDYWFAPDFVLKLSYHRVDGNRFAHPEGDALDAPLERRTDMVVVGAQFSF